jgi:hypothetical protein
LAQSREILHSIEQVADSWQKIEMIHDWRRQDDIRRWLDQLRQVVRVFVLDHVTHA